jgi:uncharacterized membrane-anchored protein
MIRNILFLITTVLVLGILNFLIIQKESVLANGQSVFMRLAPVDPRSLMQGDYMMLRYSTDTFPPDIAALPSDGKFMVKLDENRVATFSRFFDGAKPMPNEIVLRYSKRTDFRVGQDSFLIQEGTGNIYSRAKYAELKVDKNGESILVSLCDEQFVRLGPPRR